VPRIGHILAKLAVVFSSLTTSSVMRKDSSHSVRLVQATDPPAANGVRILRSNIFTLITSIFATCFLSAPGLRAEPKDPLGSVAPFLLPIPAPRPFELPVPAPSTDPTPRTFMMNGQRYDIPRNFIMTLSSNPDGTAGAISMRALLPDLAGLTPENMHCLDFRNPCSDNIVTVGLLEKHHSVPGSRLLDSIRARAQPEKFSGPCGLEFYEDRGNESQRHQHFFKRLGADADISVLKCAKKGSSYAPSCNSDYDMDDGNHFYYIFNRKFLCDWEGIRDKIVGRIASFRVGAGKSDTVREKTGD
jgi:hypothetical protein